MPTGYQIKDQHALYFLTIQVVHWTDIFTRKVYKDIVIQSLDYCRKKKDLEIYAYVVMSNHIHLLVRSNIGELSNTLRDFKRHTSKKILEAISEIRESRKEWLLMIFRYSARKHKRNNSYQVWTHENHAVELIDNKSIDQCIDYIHKNPVKAGIVRKAEEYIYSSATNFAVLESVLEIDSM